LRIVAKHGVVLVDLFVSHRAPQATRHQSALVIDLVSSGQTFLALEWTKQILLTLMSLRIERLFVDYSSPNMIQTPPVTLTSTRIRTISAAEIESVLPDLVQIFREVVNGGIPLGYLAPITLQT
jgi:hypothetical protein